MVGVPLYRPRRRYLSGHGPSRVQCLALGAAGGGARADRAIQTRGLSQRRRRVPSPMGLTMMVDGIGRGTLRNSAGGSPGLVGMTTGGRLTWAGAGSGTIGRGGGSCVTGGGGGSGATG